MKFDRNLTLGQALLSPLPEGTRLSFACYAHPPESETRNDGCWRTGDGPDAAMFYCASRAHVEKVLPALGAISQEKGAPRVGRILVLEKDGWALPIEEAMWQMGDEEIAAIRSFPIFDGEELERMVAGGEIHFAD